MQLCPAGCNSPSSDSNPLTLTSQSYFLSGACQRRLLFLALPGRQGQDLQSRLQGANQLKMSLSCLFCMHPSLVFVVFMFLLSHGASVPVSGGMPWRCSPRVNGSESGFCLAGGRESFCHVFSNVCGDYQGPLSTDQRYTTGQI